ncbi:hypothetical protein JTB14_018971 [Gonioctena quinquepunctata]|nr:hypothetical protein JTB14_018971 [Gonioctena quinquepunctata]
MDNYICKICEKTFTIRSNLKRHITHTHSKSTAVQQKYICHNCSKCYVNKSNLIRHVSKCSSDNERQKCPRKIECVLCNNYKDIKANLLKHYSLDHDIEISMENFQFTSFLEFGAWKEQIEVDTVSKYVKHDSIKTIGNIKYYYKCHRDGFYKTEGKNIRQVKLKGSNKIDGYCPSKIAATVFKTTGEVDVQFLRAHVGHTMDLEKIPLEKSDRNLLAFKISQKIPFDEIINDIRDNFDVNNYSRLHLVTKKDLFNIEQLYKLNKKSDRHADDCASDTSVKSWIVQSPQNATIYLDEDHTEHLDEGHEEYLDEGHEEYQDEGHEEHLDEEQEELLDEVHEEHLDEHHEEHLDENHEENLDEDHEEHLDEDTEEHLDEDHEELLENDSGTDVDQYKEKLSQMFQTILNFVNTVEQCEIIDKALVPFHSTLTKINSENSIDRNYNTSANANISNGGIEMTLSHNGILYPLRINKIEDLKKLEIEIQ